MVELELPHDPAAPAQARARVDDLGIRPDRCAELKLVVSELVTNAVVHGDGPVSLRLRAEGDAVRGEVSDRGSGFRPPEPQTDASGDPEGGRGLLLVAALCRRWEVDPKRSRVRFEFPLAA